MNMHTESARDALESLSAPLAAGVASALDVPRGRTSEFSSVFGCRWRWLLAFGVGQLIAGAAAIVAPDIATLLTAASFAWILVFTGVFQVFHAYRVHPWQGFTLHFASGLLYAAAGLLILFNPGPGLMSLTLLVAALLIFEGALRGVLTSRVRGRDGWVRFMLGGVASIALGAFILLAWPADSMWAPGLLLGVELLVASTITIPLALNCRAREADRTGAVA